MVRGKEVDDQIAKEERVNHCSDDRPEQIVFVRERQPPRCSDAHEEDQQSDQEVPHGLERVVRQYYEVVVDSLVTLRESMTRGFPCKLAIIFSFLRGMFRSLV